MPVPQTSQRRSFFGLRMACSSFGCWGSTARRNHRQIRLREINCGQTPSSSRQSPLEKLQQRFVRPRTLRSCPGVRRKSEPSGSRSMGSSLCIFGLLCDEFCVRWIVQRDEGGLAQPLLFSDNQAAVLQLPEDPRGALAAAVELGLRLFQGEVQPNRAVWLDVAVLPGNAGSVQQQRIEYLGVVADVPQGFVLEKKPRERYIGRCWALRRELAKIFHLTSYPIHPIRCIDWIDRLILLYLDLFLIS